MYAFFVTIFSPDIIIFRQLYTGTDLGNRIREDDTDAACSTHGYVYKILI